MLRRNTTYTHKQTHTNKHAQTQYTYKSTCTHTSAHCQHTQTTHALCDKQRRKNTHKHTQTHTSAHPQNHTHESKQTHAHESTHKHKDTAHINTHTHKHTSAHTNKHTHTHTNTRLLSEHRMEMSYCATSKEEKQDARSGAAGNRSAHVVALSIHFCEVLTSAQTPVKFQKVINTHSRAHVHNHEHVHAYAHPRINVSRTHTKTFYMHAHTSAHTRKELCAPTSMLTNVHVFTRVYFYTNKSPLKKG